MMPLYRSPCYRTTHVHSAHFGDRMTLGTLNSVHKLISKANTSKVCKKGSRDLFLNFMDHFSHLDG